MVNVTGVVFGSRLSLPYHGPLCEAGTGVKESPVSLVGASSKAWR